MDRASFDLLFRPEILIGVSDKTDAVLAHARSDGQPVNRIVRALNTSRSCGHADGRSRGVGFSRLFSRFSCAGQYAFYEKPNPFFRRVINLVIPIALVVGPIIYVLRRCLRFVQWLAHVVNHMSGVAQIVGNISQARGNLTQVFGRTSHV
ncbi:hypothetical protein SAMN04515648_4528 [Phyllobacterium sp. CL33Tsu]|nr:hypothetical protein SAMN04515648_4528 [Phyllobacterium sp. CL33Tsu]